MDIPSTMTEQVESAKNLEISYRILHPPVTLHNEETDINIEIPFSSLMNKYRDYLSDIIIEVPLDDVLQNKYRFKPKMISSEIYGTTELWDTILILNHCFRVSEFKPKVLKVYDPNRLKEYINTILIIEGYLN